MSNLKRLEYQDVSDDVNKYLEKGGEPGLSVGFKCLSEFYSHKDAGITDWTGFPGSGKTYLCLESLMNLSENKSKRHGLFVPDIGSDKEIVAKLVKMRTGMDFSDRYNNKITPKQLADSMDWIFHHFVIFKKKDFKTGITPLEFWETVCNYRDDAGILHTGLIDSWKNMKHIYSNREDLYLDEILSIRNEMAESANKHFHTIAHAVKTEADNSGKRRIPTAWDIKGGGSWYANGKNVITVDFPNKLSNRVDLYVSKVKPEDVGRVGSIIDKLYLDFRKGRYYEVINGKNAYGYDYITKADELKANKVPQVEINFEPPSADDVDTDEYPF